MKAFLSFFKNFTIGKKLLLLLTPILSAILSMKAAILGLIILIVLDLLTGIRKNLHMRGIPFNILKREFWKAIKSYLLRQTWKKTYEYAFGIVTMVVIGKLVFGGVPLTVFGKSMFMSELSVLIPAAIEVWSIFENLEAVSGKNILKIIKNFLPTPLASIFSSGKEKAMKEAIDHVEVVEEELIEPEDQKNE